MAGHRLSHPPSRKLSIISPLWNGSDKYYRPYIGKGKVLLSGPDGYKNHVVKILDPTYIGHGTASPEATGSLSYIWRAPPGTAFPNAKAKRTGEIGWHVFPYNAEWIPPKILFTSGIFRQAVEDRYTHRYQNPVYPDKQKKSSPLLKRRAQSTSHRPLSPALEPSLRPRSSTRSRPRTALSLSATEIHKPRERCKSASSSSSRTSITN